MLARWGELLRELDLTISTNIFVNYRVLHKDEITIVKLRGQLCDASIPHIAYDDVGEFIKSRDNGLGLNL